MRSTEPDPQVALSTLITAWALTRPQVRRTFLAAAFLTFIGVGFSGSNLPVVGYAALIASGSISLVTYRRATRRATAISETLQPTADRLGGIGDPIVTWTVLDAVRALNLPDRSIRRTLPVLIAAMLTEEGMIGRRNCFNGHTPLCAHRIDREALTFWREVAATY